MRLVLTAAAVAAGLSLSAALPAAQSNMAAREKFTAFAVVYMI
jgi:hypothetical protein